MLIRLLALNLNPARAALLVAVVGSAPPGWSSTDGCTTIDSAEARLACYDRLHGRAEASSEAPDSRSVPESAGAPSELPAADPPDRAGQDILARVVAAGRDITGRRWFRLDSGQLWEQVTATRTDIAPGDSVRIAASAIGTYHLRRSDGTSRSSQVRRLE